MAHWLQINKLVDLGLEMYTQISYLQIGGAMLTQSQLTKGCNRIIKITNKVNYLLHGKEKKFNLVFKQDSHAVSEAIQ